MAVWAKTYMLTPQYETVRFEGNALSFDGTVRLRTSSTVRLWISAPNKLGWLMAADVQATWPLYDLATTPVDVDKPTIALIKACFLTIPAAMTSRVMDESRS